MAKGSGKSSASSGTRKKHARKAVGGGTQPGPPPPPDQSSKKAKGGKKGSKKEPPRQKQYIPPKKPAPPQPDPLDTSGLAHRLPPELLVVLRSLSKKASVTKVKALEDLQSKWLDRVPEDESVSWVLADMVPVWVRTIALPLISAVGQCTC
jgi:E3 ubiquitin-protein ligase listerin